AASAIDPSNRPSDSFPETVLLCRNTLQITSHLGDALPLPLECQQGAHGDCLRHPTRSIPSRRRTDICFVRARISHSCSGTSSRARKSHLPLDLAWAKCGISNH